MAACDGCLASRTCCLASFDEGAVGTGFLVGDTAGVRPKSSILVETPGGTGSMFDDAVWIGPKSVGLVLAKNDGGPFGG